METCWRESQMNKQRARRLALLVICNEITGMIDTSDEWTRHPETDELFTFEETKSIKREAQVFVGTLERRIGKMRE